MVAVQHRAGFIDQKATIRIAVIGDSRVRSFSEYPFAQKFRMRRADARVDIDAVRFGRDRDDFRAEFTQDGGRHRGSRAVRRVHNDFQTVQTARRRGCDVIRIALRRLRNQLNTTDRIRRRSRAVTERILAQHVFNFVFRRVRQFKSVTVKKFDAVIGIRIVRGGNHYARLVIAGARQVRDPRRRNDADDIDIAARRANARRQCRGKHRTRDAGVETDQKTRARASVISPDKKHGRRASQMKREFRCQCLIDDAAHTVRTK